MEFSVQLRHILSNSSSGDYCGEEKKVLKQNHANITETKEHQKKRMGREEQNGLVVYVKGRKGADGEKLMPEIHINDHVHERIFFNAMLGLFGIAVVVGIVAVVLSSTSCWILTALLLCAMPTFSILMASRRTTIYPPDADKESDRGVIRR